MTIIWYIYRYIYIYALHTCHRTFTRSLLLWWANESICCGKGQSMFAQSYFPLRFDSTLITMKPTLPVWFGSVSPIVSKLFDLQSLEWDVLIVKKLWSPNSSGSEVSKVQRVHHHESWLRLHLSRLGRLRSPASSPDGDWWPRPVDPSCRTAALFRPMAAWQQEIIGKP